MKCVRIAVALGVLLCAGGVWAQDKTDYCDAFEKTPLPVGDLPTLAQARAVGKGCSAIGFYYGDDADRLRKARLCGYAGLGAFRDGGKTARDAARGYALGVPVEAVADNDDIDDAPETLTLAMLYANGEGVRKNLPLARHFACMSSDWNTPAEIAKSLGSERFDVCDAENGTSGYGRRTNYVCLVIAGGKLSEAIAAEEARLKRELPAAELAAWEKLRKARADYMTAHAPEEPNGTTGAVQSAMAEDVVADKEWLGVMKAVAAGKVPTDVLGAEPLATVDKALNVDYQEVLKEDAASCPSGGEGCTSPDQARSAERAWLRYREAWVRFGAVRWPEVSADQWRAWLTAQRVEVLGG
jgi:hypothetical protein